MEMRYFDSDESDSKLYQPAPADPQKVAERAVRLAEEAEEEAVAAQVRAEYARCKAARTGREAGEAAAALAADAAARRKAMKEQLTQSLLLAITALVAIVAVCIAWFASNSRVSGSGMQISAQGARFELASTGDYGCYDIESEGHAIAGNSITFADAVYSATGGEKDSISWLVSDGSQLNNTKKTQAMQPNSSGSISFSVISQVSDLDPEKMSFTLDIIPYRAALLKEDGTLADTEAADDVIQIDGSYYAPIADDTTEYALQQGHLRFFSDYSQAQRYNGLLTSGETFTIQPTKVAEATSTSPARWDYTLHWVWPGYFEQFVERGKGDSLFGMDDSATDTWKKMLAELKETPGWYFANTDGTSVEFSTEDLNKICDTMSTADILLFSGLYNNADEQIGRNVRFVSIRLSAREN